MVQFLNLAFVDDIVNNFKLIFGRVIWVFKTLLSAIWMLVYGIASLMLMFLDFVQDCFKKLAGLDTYYYEDSSGAFENEDILQRLLTTPEILKAFGSLVVVGIILLFLFTIIQFIRVEYTTEGAKNSKGNIIQQALKAVAMFVIVPVASLIGIFLSNKVLQIIDNATDPSPGSTFAGNIFKIAVYDANPIRAGESKIGGFGMFQQEALYLREYDAYKGPEILYTEQKNDNYVTYKLKIKDYSNGNDQYVKGFANVAKMQIADTGRTEKSPTGVETSVYKIFAGTKNIVFEDDGKKRTVYAVDPNKLTPTISGKEGEELAEAIDDMMSHRGRESAKSSTVKYKSETGNETRYIGIGLKEGSSLDYTNTFAVAYFYNMQDINYFILFVCSGFAIVCLYKAAFGMIMRLYMCAILFVISPPIIAMAPMDNGKALSSWKSKFLGQVIAAYGTVVALNVFFTIMPIIEKIELFRGDDVPWKVLPASFFNGCVQCVFVLVGCFMLKDISKTISGLIGAEDAMASGDGMSKQVGAVAAKAASVGVGLAGAGAGMIMKAGAGIAGKVASKQTAKAEENVAEHQKELDAAIASGDQNKIDAAQSKLEISQDYLASRQKKEQKVVSASLTGARLMAGGSSNLKKFAANSGIGKTVSGILGDYSPSVLGGKGLKGHDEELAAYNQYYESEIEKQGDEIKGKKRDKALKSMGGAAEAAQHIADRSTLSAAGASLENTIKEQKNKTVAEVTDMKNKMLAIMDEIKNKRLDKDKGEEQIYKLYSQAKQSGVLTDKSQASLDSFMSALHQSSSGKNAIAAVEAQLKNSTTFESKIEVAMKDGTIEAQLNEMKKLAAEGRSAEAIDIGNKVQAQFSKSHVDVNNLAQQIKKIAEEAKDKKAEDKDMKKLLAQLGKMASKK